MQTAHELFIYELADMLDAERRLVDALGEQAETAANPQLRKLFSSHQAQTEKHVQRLEQVFEQFGDQPEQRECKGMKGLLDEASEFKDERPSPDVLDTFTIGAAMKVESYETDAYESLIRLDKYMNHTKAIKLLQQNLKEEQDAWKKLDGLAKKVKPERTGHETEEEEEPRRGRRRAA
jgi:ferritin-like metal-binding protein YciE